MLTVSSLLQKFLDLYEIGLLGPLPEVKYFSAQDIQSGFRFLQDGSHIGKVVIKMHGYADLLQPVPTSKTVAFDPKGSYLLTGGFGGLGKSMATWLVEHGARSLTFLSRSAGTSEDSLMFIKELEKMGCSVAVVAGGADSMDDVQRAVAASAAPIRGVFHLAMVLRVRSLEIPATLCLVLTIAGFGAYRHGVVRLGRRDQAQNPRCMEPP